MKWRNIKLYSPESKLQKYLSCKRQKHHCYTLNTQVESWFVQILLSCFAFWVFCTSMQHVSEVWQQENLHQVNHNSRVKRQKVSVRPASSQIYCLLSVCTCIPPPQNVGLKLSSIFFTAITVSFCESVTKYEIIFWIISHVLVSRSTENYSGRFR